MGRYQGDVNRGGDSDPFVTQFNRDAVYTEKFPFYSGTNPPLTERLSLTSVEVGLGPLPESRNEV